MSWNEYQAQWQRSEVPPLATTPDEIVRRAARLHRTLRLRDMRETVIAVLLLPLFVVQMWTAWHDQAWVRLGFVGVIVLWLIFLPWHLWRARRQLPVIAPQLPLSIFLDAQRRALLMQSTMLKGAWLWYVAPCTIGVIGMTLSRHGVTRMSMVAVLAYLLLGICVTALNRYAARKTFHPQIEAIDRQLQMLAVDDTHPFHPNQDDPS